MSDDKLGLYKVKVQEKAGDKSRSYFTRARDIDHAMEKAVTAASDSFVEDAELLEVVSAAEVFGDWIP